MFGLSLFYHRANVNSIGWKMYTFLFIDAYQPITYVAREVLAEWRQIIRGIIRGIKSYISNMLS